MNKTLRKAVIAGNWKMNKTPAETAELITAMKPLVADADCGVVLCVPFVDIPAALEAAKGYNVGTSLIDETKIDYCKDMLAKAEAKGVKLLLPVDNVCAKAFPDPIDGDVETAVFPADAIDPAWMGLDIGPATRELFAGEVKSAKTVVWNGPMGVFENPKLAEGTIAVAKALSETDAITIIGGGDSAAAVNSLGFGDKMSHISTGGGASLEFLEGKELPGVAAADDK